MSVQSLSWTGGLDSLTAGIALNKFLYYLVPMFCRPSLGIPLPTSCPALGSGHLSPSLPTGSFSLRLGGPVWVHLSETFAYISQHLINISSKAILITST